MSQTDTARKLIEARKPVSRQQWADLTTELMAVINHERQKPITRTQARVIISRALAAPRKRGGYHPARGT